MSPIIPVRVDPDVRPYVVKDGTPVAVDHPLATEGCPVCGEDLAPGPVSLVFVGREPELSRWSAAAVAVHDRCTGITPAAEVTDDQIGGYWDARIAPGLIATGVPADEVARQRAQYVRAVRANPRSLDHVTVIVAESDAATFDAAQRLTRKLVDEDDFDGLAALIALLVSRDRVTDAGLILRGVVFNAVVTGAQNVASVAESARIVGPPDGR